MIRKIGVIYQDATSRGFLEGLRDRLKCTAELIDPPIKVPGQRLPKRKAKLAREYFQRHGVDLIVQFTDADGNSWQGVQRRELGVVPDEAKSVWLCGVAVNNPEEWMCGDVSYLAEVLAVSPEELGDPANRTGVVKKAIGRAKRPEEKKSETVARIVRDAPAKVFRRWLEDDALRSFYSDCWAAATAADCETHTELEATDDD